MSFVESQADAEHRADAPRFLAASRVEMVNRTSPLRSLSGRLMAIFFATAVALIFAASAILYWAAEQALRYADDQVVEKRMMAISGLLTAKELNEGMLGHEVGEDNQGPRQIFIRVVSRYQPIALETPGMEKVLPSSLFPDMRAAPFESPQHLTISSADRGETYRALSIRVPVAALPEYPDAIIQVATDTTLDNDAMNWFRRLLAAVLAAALPLSAFASWLLVKSELKPLERITAAAEAVDSATIDKRLALDGMPLELHQLGLQFNGMLDRLEQTWTELKHYADTIAHEMRTPLNRMRLQSEIALRDSETPEELRTVVTANMEECERLSHLLQALLFLARADSKQAAIQSQRLNLATELTTIADFFEASASAARTSIAIACPDRLSIDADRALLQRALGNLISNAIAHTPPGGKISVDVSRIAAEGARAPAVAIAISDTGDGIALEHHQRIFDRFYRASMTGQTGYDRDGDTHLGLGLSIVKSIVSLHGGTIVLDSTPGKGTTFTVHLPAA